jgi:predicted nucleic acid-binding protein
LSEIKAITTPLVIGEVSYILLLQKGSMILGTHDRKSISDKIKRDRGFANLCYSVIDRFNELLNVLDGLKVIPIGSEDHLQVSDVGKKYGLLPNDALHLVAMKNSNIRNIATRDKDFERVEGIEIWSP